MGESRVHNTVLGKQEGIGSRPAGDRVGRGREGAHDKQVVRSGGTVDVGPVDVGFQVGHRAVARAAVDRGDPGIPGLAAQGGVARTSKLENFHIADIGEGGVEDAVLSGDLKRVSRSVERDAASGNRVTGGRIGAHDKQVVRSVRQVDVGPVGVGLKVGHRAVARAAVDRGDPGVTGRRAQCHVARTGKLESLHVADVGEGGVEDAVLCGDLKRVSRPVERDAASGNRITGGRKGTHDEQVVRSVRQVDVGRIGVGLQVGHGAVARAAIDRGDPRIASVATQGHIARAG